MLDFKIKELKKQIEPREVEIGKMRQVRLVSGVARGAACLAACLAAGSARGARTRKA